MNVSSLTKFDWAKIVAFAIALLIGLTPILKPVLQPWGVTDAEVANLSLRIGSILAVLTFIAGILKSPSTPDGTHAVLSTDPVPTPSTLTTRTALAGDSDLAAKKAELARLDAEIAAKTAQRDAPVAPAVPFPPAAPPV